MQTMLMATTNTLTHLTTTETAAMAGAQDGMGGILVGKDVGYDCGWLVPITMGTRW